MATLSQRKIYSCIWGFTCSIRWEENQTQFLPYESDRCLATLAWFEKKASKHNRVNQQTCIWQMKPPLRYNQNLYLFVPYDGSLSSRQAGTRKGRGQRSSWEIDVRTENKQPANVWLSQLFFFLVLCLSECVRIILDSRPDHTLPRLCLTWDGVDGTGWNRIRVGPCGKEWHRIADKVIRYSGIAEECGW